VSFSVRVRRSATISLDLRLLAQPVRRSLPAARASIRSPRSRRSVSMTKGRTIALCDAKWIVGCLVYRDPQLRYRLVQLSYIGRVIVV
jgi:hypothetical protein